MSTAAPNRTSTARAEFFEADGRRLFGLHVAPTGPVLGSAVYVPAFAEEMNRCRSHAASQARALAAAGVHCLLIDLYGTGESDGGFEDATWEIWRNDVAAAARHVLQLSGHAPTLWGVRTGALLAAEVAAAAHDGPPRLLFWQPVLDGKLFLNQYLRLRIASQMVSESERETTEQIRARLTRGEVLEIAGYPLTRAMADGLAGSRIASVALPPSSRIAWLEIVAKPDQPLSIPSRRQADEWVSRGVDVLTDTVACPMIWQLHERADAPELEAATLRLWGERT